MGRTKIDDRIRLVIENGVELGHRTMFFLIGEKAREQVVILHQMLSKTSESSRPNVLWCFKNDLGFNSHGKKYMRKLQKKIKSGSLNTIEDDPFELFIASTNIRYSHYTETHKILGNTYKMCILQDFEALTPNLLARTIETVEGGGLIVFLVRSVNSLKELYSLSMDVHDHYRTEAHPKIIGRFNERFLLSLDECKRCLVLDDQLTILPLASQNLQVEPKKTSSEQSEDELKTIKNEQDSQPASALVNCCKTADQAKALLKFIKAISDKSLRSTVSLTAARGRGKSAALGLAIAGAVASNYSNIFVTSPSPENLSTLFEFIFKGFDALDYKENIDYEIIQSTNPEFNKAIVRVNIFREHKQTIQFISPDECQKLGQAELVVIDEAAAIPLPLVRSLLGPYLVFLASTINGYEGTGRSLSLKLLQQLRQQAATLGSKTPNESTGAAIGRALHEVELHESIRYQPNDEIERWLASLLCLDSAGIIPVISKCPPPDSCELYYINRDTLFSYHRASEKFLQRLVSLFVASHYKNTPNDLQMMSDAPAHHLFCLLGPVDPDTESLPEVLVVIQICLEGKISPSTISSGLHRGKRASGDLIPWTVSQQYQDQHFPQLSGARIVRIATHPDYQSMGYGRYALKLLHKYYCKEIQLLVDENQSKDKQETEKKSKNKNVSLYEERIEPRESLPPLLLKLSQRPPEHLDYLGVSYGLTAQLLRFWKRAGFVPVYLRQTKNDLTGEHSCIMLSPLDPNSKCLEDFYIDFRRKIISLLGYQFSEFPPSLGISLLSNNVISIESKEITKSIMSPWLTKQDINRLEMYSNNMADYHLIIDLLPALARFYFLGLLGEIKFSALQSALMLGIGLQHKNIEKLASELGSTSSMLLGLFNRTIRRYTQYLITVMESPYEKDTKKKSSKNHKEKEEENSQKLIASDKDEESVKEHKENQTKERKKSSKNQSINKQTEIESVIKKKRNNSLTKSSEKRSSDATENDSQNEAPKKKKKKRKDK